ncbi:hypothetical protein QBC35DRAFT_476448 [Podospora australis]|uniref:Uncharacterized protein n=1 Tax=Podospora australis TaxID=1536484 RepID=A0AAN6WP16_9PEZI|nr:hypothetical protein QBC35DRAFT_476448 [Podospora australis]
MYIFKPMASNKKYVYSSTSTLIEFETSSVRVYNTRREQHAPPKNIAGMHLLQKEVSLARQRHRPVSEPGSIMILRDDNRYDYAEPNYLQKYAAGRLHDPMCWSCCGMPLPAEWTLDFRWAHGGCEDTGDRLHRAADLEPDWWRTLTEILRRWAHALRRWLYSVYRWFIDQSFYLACSAFFAWVLWYGHRIEEYKAERYYERQRYLDGREL